MNPQLSRRAALAAGISAAVLRSVRAKAAPPALANRVELTVGFSKSAHTAPLIAVPDMIRPLGVDLKLVEFVRYADARTAIGGGSLDIATTAPGDVLVLLSQGVTNVKAVCGMGSSDKFVMVRDAATLPNWDALRGKRLGIPAGSAVWAQYAATITERNFPYDAPKIVNIQGGGTGFIQALQRGDIDATLSWQPFESTMLVEKTGQLSSLEYGHSKAVGAELGMFTATQSALTQKREAVNRFFWAYKTIEKQLQHDQAAFATAVEAYSNVSRPIAENITAQVKLGGVVDAAQLERQARFFFAMGILQQDVSAQVAAHWDDSPVRDTAA
jgi:sulfonate transport system substrate-binding protein